ncbi:MAG: 6-carboxytetrahydropterin synthase QueD [Bacteroidetes bacterium]|nr:6-carboxytetrahydropterin synthase QueD [Bacteroidota bacterium]MBS1739311.1 6-carboxytetrahydropterin synthase QueD [Bacteroidota bacterium]MBS1775611.1 6-carboxytetrahydropterin synthase QueD [Bacteroidota bacterium]
MEAKDRGYDLPIEVQQLGKDIFSHELRYHQKRVLVSKEFRFDAAHHLHGYAGQCSHLHGHTYRVVFGISGLTDDAGIVIDFTEIKTIWKQHLEPLLDHRYLNTSLPKMNTTAENMVVWLYEQMNTHLSSKQYDLQVEFVRLYETPSSFAEARREWMGG